MLQHAFQGVRVVDLAGYIAGAYCSTLLADMGAEVVKVESSLGDAFRHNAGAFNGWNRGKRGIVVDLKSPEGKEVLCRMVARSDVVVENFRAGVPERLGVDYESLKKINPQVIYCSVTSFGHSGPHSDRPGFDPLLQARSGAMAAQGGPDGDPVFLRVAIADYGAAILGAWGVAMALLVRVRTGRGQRLETCLLNAAVANQAAEFFRYPGRVEPPRGDSLGLDATYRIYPTGDGWVFLSFGDDASFRALCVALGFPSLADDPRFASQGRRLKESQRLGDLVEAATTSYATADLVALLEGHGVRCGPVHCTRDLYDDPQLQHAEMVVELDPVDVGSVRQSGVAVKLSRTPGKVWGPAPGLGQHTDEVLAELGYAPGQIRDLRERRVVG